MSAKTEQILEDLKSLTLIEVSDLVEKLEKTFINGVYDTGHFDGEMKRSKKNYYDYKYECYLKTINR